ncbi:hypothetical protein GCM10027515_00400 [Schumannella luteola]|uniref:Uncharacterized protein n=1 Tax=Schumannella luteola TaxID=472059 RepID=A0A852YBU9_9MICO|nr:hypothetical protein [Schumannella luteola]NYG98820.1 hypothetical protein [Schumannella luteola]TPX01918.1 hypothetical protein FJ656_25030 [Schumannella luteola]
MPTRAITGLGAGAAVAVAGCAVAGAIAIGQHSPVAVTAKEANTFMAHVIESGAGVGEPSTDAVAFCNDYADDPNRCSESVAAAQSDDRDPGLKEVTISTRSASDGRVIVTVTGRDDDGAKVVSDVELIATDAGIRAIDPVYWVPRTITKG